jgi:hypothetical protein
LFPWGTGLVPVGVWPCSCGGLAGFLWGTGWVPGGTGELLPIGANSFHRREFLPIGANFFPSAQIPSPIGANSFSHRRELLPIGAKSAGAVGAKTVARANVLAIGAKSLWVPSKPPGTRKILLAKQKFLLAMRTNLMAGLGVRGSVVGGGGGWWFPMRARWRRVAACCSCCGDVAKDLQGCVAGIRDAGGCGSLPRDAASAEVRPQGGRPRLRWPTAHGAVCGHRPPAPLAPGPWPIPKVPAAGAATWTGLTHTPAHHQPHHQPPSASHGWSPGCGCCPCRRRGV